MAEGGRRETSRDPLASGRKRQPPAHLSGRVRGWAAHEPPCARQPQSAQQVPLPPPTRHSPPSANPQSEVQNTLAAEALAWDPAAPTDDPLTEAGWLYQPLMAIRKPGEDGLAAVADELLVRLWGAVREDLVRRSELKQFGQALLGVVRQTAVPDQRQNEEAVVERALNLISRPASGGANASDVVHALNLYLSAEPFSAAHVTTGTVFRHSDRDEWWVCVSPACDLVPGQQPPTGSWYAELLPLRPMTALRLSEVNVTTGLKWATHARTVFVCHDGRRLCFTAFDEPARHAKPETFFLFDEGRTPSRFSQALSVKADHKEAGSRTEPIPRGHSAMPGIREPVAATCGGLRRENRRPFRKLRAVA